ncbi:MAG TPA: DUF6152 family protein [Gammaproteobacteria bacterium]|nr:DUF6152 family protein [Gammaproteobacteria bacterium]
MKKTLIGSLMLAGLGLATSAQAHHSFAGYDMTKNIEFVGTVQEIKFRNPHIEMTLKRMTPDGKEEIIHFVEGAPANMLVRLGLEPSMVTPGSKIKAIGSPRKERPDEYFLKTIVLEDGREFQSLK